MQEQSNQRTTKAAVIEAILFFLGQEISYKELCRISGYAQSEITSILEELQKTYEGRGLSVITTEKGVLLSTSERVAGVIDALQKDEETKPLSKASLEALSIVAYRGPISRADIDYVRGVNSTYSLRILLMRGLIDRTKDGSSVLYSPSIDTFRFMGVDSKETLPDFVQVQDKIIKILERKKDEESKESPQQEAQEEIN